MPLGSTDFRLLLALVQSAGTIVTKNELMSRVWGRVTVEDNVLYVHISALRKVLGNDLIENHQRYGYRLAVPVQRVVADTVHPQIKPARGNLPSLWTSSGATGGATRLIGRSGQLRILADLLAHGCLVTLTGPGGSGKTRLALQAANDASPHFCDGVWLVELASLNDPNAVPGALASTLGVRVGAKATPLDTLSRYLTRKSVLVVLDNCEHVLASCVAIAETLLSTAPGVKILTTSREALSCCGEQVLEVPPLAVPGEGAMPPDAMRDVAAIDLFIERATEADAGFVIANKDLSSVARICRRVDGLPLAIEMAAGWVGVLGLETLNERLDGSFRAWLRARNTAPSRHRTLRATLEWSYGLLSTAERAVLCRLAVFAGSFTMVAAEAVAGNDALPQEEVFEHVANLVRKSMVSVVPGSRIQRYRLLETTRAFMREISAASLEGDAVRCRHACHVLSVFETANLERETTSDVVWLERYGPLLDDLRAAFDWAMSQKTDHAVALAGASWPLWRELSLRPEGRQRLSAAAARIGPYTPPALEARLRRGLGEILIDTAASKTAHDELERAAILYRSLGDSSQLGSALTTLGFSLFTLNRFDDAEQAISEAMSLLKPTGWSRILAVAYLVQMEIESTRGDFDAARVAGEKAACLSKLAGADRTALVVAANLVQISLEGGDVDGALTAGHRLAVQLRDTRNSDIRGFVLGVLTAAFSARGDLSEALATAREAVPILRDEGTLFWLFDHLDLCAALNGRVKDAALIAGFADAAYEKAGRPREPMGRNAVERLRDLLRDALPEHEIARLGDMGAQLTEDQALTLALGD